MSDSNVNEVVLRTRVEGVPDSLQSLDMLAARIQSLNGPVSSGSSSNVPSGAPAWAPQPPQPYVVGESGATYQPGGGPPPMMASPGGGGAMVPYVPPGFYAPKPDPGGMGGGSGGGGGALAPYDAGGGGAGGKWTMHVDTMNVIAQTVNILGQNVNLGGGGAGGGIPGAPGVPAAPLPGPGPFNVNVPPVPATGGGPSWQAFAQQVMRNPSISGIMGAVGQQMPLGSVAAVTAASQFGNWMIDQEMALYAPQFRTETHQQAQRESGQYVNPYIAAAESRAALGEGAIARERVQIAPIGWIPGIHQAAEMEFMREEREIALIRARGQATATESHLSGVTGVPTRNFPRGSDRRPDPYGLDYRAGGAQMLGIYGGAAAGQFVGSITGAEDAAFRAFGPEGMLRAEGTIAQAGTDVTRPGLRGALIGGEGIRPGATVPSSVLSTAQMAASKGDLQTLFALLPYFAASGQRREWEELVRLAQQMMDVAGRGIVAGQVTQLATMSGAGSSEVVGDIHAQVQIETGKLNELMAAQQAAPDNLKGDYTALINQQRITVQQLRVQGAQTYFGRREQTLGAESLGASVTQQQLLFGGASGPSAFGGVFAERGRVLSEQASLKEAESRRSDVYSPGQRAQFTQEARQLRMQAQIELPREAAGLYLGQAESLTGLHGAEAGFAGTVAGLFGGPSERAAVVGQEERVVAEHLKNIQDRLDRGNLLDTERNQLLTEQKNLQGQAISLQQERIRGEAAGFLSNAQGEFGIAQTERGTAAIRGVGGLPGEAMGFQSVQRARDVLARARAALATYDNAEDSNPQKIAARAAVASAEQGLAQTEESLAHTAAPIGLRRDLSAAGYQAQVLQMIPGSYGNIRGALQRQVSTLEQMGQTKQAEYRRVVEQYGGEQNVPDHVKFGFQQELQQLGLQQAGAAQQLAYGWESRLISQAIGTPGSYAMYANRFSFRDAVGAGITNPHFGANHDQLPFFLRQAATVGSTAGSADPLGFASGAMTGVRGDGRFSIGGVSERVNRMGGAATAPIRIEIQLKWPDGKSAGHATVTTNSADLSADGLSNAISSLFRNH